MDNTDDLPAIRQQRNLLLDFYGPMLTKRQATCFTMRYVEDCSLTEIAHELNISPQAVVDFIKRSVERLERYEEQLGLVRKFQMQQAVSVQILAKLDEIEREIGPMEPIKWIRDAIDELII